MKDLLDVEVVDALKNHIEQMQVLALDRRMRMVVGLEENRVVVGLVDDDDGVDADLE